MTLLLAEKRRAPKGHRTTGWRVALVATVLATGCGSGAAGGASPVSAPGPSVPADGPSLTPGPSEESVARFGADVVGRLEQDAFYAPDSSFLDRFVSPGAFEQVVGALDARVADVRWAVATFPGETRRVWFASAPLSVAVTGFDGDAGTASVEVWVVSVFSREDLGPPEMRFSLERADLVWDDTTGGWLIVSLATSPGPAAALASDQIPVTPGELDSVLADHRLVPATGAVGR